MALLPLEQPRLGFFGDGTTHFLLGPALAQKLFGWPGPLFFGLTGPIFLGVQLRPRRLWVGQDYSFETRTSPVN